MWRDRPTPRASDVLADRMSPSSTAMMNIAIAPITHAHKRHVGDRLAARPGRKTASIRRRAVASHATRRLTSRASIHHMSTSPRTANRMNGSRIATIVERRCRPSRRSSRRRCATPTAFMPAAISQNVSTGLLRKPSCPVLRATRCAPSRGPAASSARPRRSGSPTDRRASSVEMPGTSTASDDDARPARARAPSGRRNIHARKLSQRANGRSAWRASPRCRSPAMPCRPRSSRACASTSPRYQGDVIPLQIGDTHLHRRPRSHDVAWAEPRRRRPLRLRRARRLGPARRGDRRQGADENGWRHGATSRSRSARPTRCRARCRRCAIRGDELILLTPHWPLIRGIALGHGVTPVEVAVRRADECRDHAERTSAIYVATPNNPDGAMLDARPQLDAIARARRSPRPVDPLRRGLRGLRLRRRSTCSLATPGAATRTVTVFSFAKCYAQAGLRVGYALGPEPAIAAIRKLVNHCVYNVPVAMQRAALAALADGAAVPRDGARRATARRAIARGARLARTGRAAARRRVPVGRLLALVAAATACRCSRRVAAAGVLLAPGSAFGDACGSHARLCFTGVDEARLDEGIDRINAVLAAW